MGKADRKDKSRKPDWVPEVRIPGVRELHEAVANYARKRAPKKKTFRTDVLAGLNTAIANVPDGMANAVLVGVSPIHGLYATIVGPMVGGFFSSTQVMVVTTTAAASLTAAQSLARFSPDSLPIALFILVVMVGILQVLFGYFRMGKLIRFVSFSVTTGLLTGIAVLLILSQLPQVSGVNVSASNRLVQTYQLFTRIGEVNGWSLGLAALTLALAVLLPRTRMGNLGRLVAIVVPSIIAVFLANGVENVGELPGGIPKPSMPQFSLAFDVLTGALAVAVVILVQGAGVSQSVSNPDDSRPRLSRDFMAQGWANVASGIFQGLPVGGSVSATALGVISGAVTRWAVILAGVWMLLIVVIFNELVEYVIMPSLGAMLILVGFQSIKTDDLATVWHAGWPARIAALTTFIATLNLPIQISVGLGVALSAALYVYRASTDVTLIQMHRREDGRFEERPAPDEVPGGKVTVLDVYGHLFFGGARTLERILPQPEKDAEHPVVILRLRGRDNLGGTALDVLANYARALHKAKGRLYLTGLSEGVHREVNHERKLDLKGPVRAYEVTPILGESTTAAHTDAEAWLIELKEQEQD